MSTAKEEVRKMLDQIFDDASFEDIQYHIYVREKIERGLKDIKEGRVLSQEEVERRMSKWLGRQRGLRWLGTISRKLRTTWPRILLTMPRQVFVSHKIIMSVIK
ncbi:hypothetical protein [Candidatus Hakubella thermalkaliphila]|uniref:hypothetical protein n=2 Tax=Candidatus Hakubella thermalkaliphila TaxID=2754717 RepID=UPI00280C33BF|nr:hypothetical protein [Candidatus Hakubella thermalkaliphila]